MKLAAIQIVLAVVVCGLLVCAAAAAPGADSFTKEWQVRFPRAQMLATWEKLKKLEIPGVPVDMRFKITGQEFYVSPSGDDSAAGTKDKPWKTLKMACSQMKPNTVVYLMAGTYYGPESVTVKATAEAPAALRAVEGSEVILTYSPQWIAQRKAELGKPPAGKSVEGAVDPNGQSLHYEAPITLVGAYTEISGMHIIGVRDQLPHNLFTEDGVTLSGGCGNRVLYNEVENVGHCGIKAMDHGEKGYLIEGNYLHDLGHTGHDHGIYCPSDDGVIRKNLITNSTGYGVHAYEAPKRIIITHNIIAGHADAGIVLGGPDAIVANNVLWKNNMCGVFFFRAGCTNAKVVNNIFAEPKGAFMIDNDPSANFADYNCLTPDTPQGTDKPAVYTFGRHNLKADPHWANAAIFDLRLGFRSPCVEAGDPTVGMYYGRAPDIGLQKSGKPPTKGQPITLPDAVRDR